MPIIYRKTAKGQTEIETRAHRLAPRLRSLLIMVDGRRSDVEFAQMLPQAAEALAALVQEGFIAEHARTAAAAPALSPAPAPAPAPSPSAGSTAPARDTPATAVPRQVPAAAQFEAMRRDLLRAFNDRLGPVGERMAIKLERARDEAEFRSLLPAAVQFVAAMQGRDAAAAFSARIDAW